MMKMGEGEGHRHATTINCMRAIRDTTLVLN